VKGGIEITKKENPNVITLSKEAAQGLKASIVEGPKNSFRIFMSGIG
jgi:hypothetical protein